MSPNINDYEKSPCLLSNALKLISKKWTLHIFCQLFEKEALSYNELLTQIKNDCGKEISPSILSQTLKYLINQQLIEKNVDNNYFPPKSEYKLTPKGKELRDIYAIIKSWALKWYNLMDKEELVPNQCYILDLLPGIEKKVDFVLGDE